MFKLISITDATSERIGHEHAVRTFYNNKFNKKLRFTPALELSDATITTGTSLGIESNFKRTGEAVAKEHHNISNIYQRSPDIRPTPRFILIALTSRDKENRHQSPETDNASDQPSVQISVKQTQSSRKSKPH